MTHDPADFLTHKHFKFSSQPWRRRSTVTAARPHQQLRSLSHSRGSLRRVPLRSRPRYRRQPRAASSGWAVLACTDSDTRPGPGPTLQPSVRRSSGARHRGLPTPSSVACAWCQVGGWAAGPVTGSGCLGVRASAARWRDLRYSAGESGPGCQGGLLAPARRQQFSPLGRLELRAGGVLHLPGDSALRLGLCVPGL